MRYFALYGLISVFFMAVSVKTTQKIPNGEKMQIALHYKCHLRYAPNADTCFGRTLQLFIDLTCSFLTFPSSSSRTFLCLKQALKLQKLQNINKL